MTNDEVIMMAHKCAAHPCSNIKCGISARASGIAQQALDKQAPDQEAGNELEAAIMSLWAESVTCR